MYYKIDENHLTCQSRKKKLHCFHNDAVSEFSSLCNNMIRF